MSAEAHKRIECSQCGKVIMTCRCWKAAENVEYTVCEECKKKEEDYCGAV